MSVLLQTALIPHANHCMKWDDHEILFFLSGCLSLPDMTDDSYVSFLMCHVQDVCYFLP